MTTQTHTATTTATAGAPDSGRAVATVLLGVAGLVGVIIALVGGALIAVHAFARDADGFYTSDTERLESSGYAIVSDELALGQDTAGIDFDEVAATLRFDVDSTSAESLFVGIGPSDDVRRYMAGVEHSDVTDFAGGDPVYDELAGRAPRTNPGAQSFWVAESEGVSQQRIDWKVENGDWSVVAMNADASQGVTVDAEAGAKISWLIWVGIGLAGLGLAVTAGAGFGISRVRR